ncbi:hypothetical protein L596_014291 [Steinernema carpocapsae]|uniref:Uncharacterized protein n=1 Tax=Steinernema carpocapsae TaxID=34508 RepID=A0A4V6A2S0_STECR|nr:hypothetical protein L596_014291 [Steinernema carpocapsae]
MKALVNLTTVQAHYETKSVSPDRDRQSPNQRDSENRISPGTQRSSSRGGFGKIFRKDEHSGPILQHDHYHQPNDSRPPIPRDRSEVLPKKLGIYQNPFNNLRNRNLKPYFIPLSS